MAKTKKRADGLIERCRVIDGKTRHFYGRTAKEVQAKLDAALIEASTRRDRGDPFCEVAEAFWRAKEPCIKYGSRRGYRHKVELAKGWFEGQGMREITSTDINRELMHMAAQGYAYKSIAGQKSVLSLIWQYWCAEMHGDAKPLHAAQAAARPAPDQAARPPQSRRSPMLRPTPRASASARPS